MKNFEVQHTIRLYDTELIAEIGRTFKLRAELALTDVAAELKIAIVNANKVTTVLNTISFFFSANIFPSVRKLMLFFLSYIE